jgi:hypothetical protein
MTESSPNAATDPEAASVDSRPLGDEPVTQTQADQTDAGSDDRKPVASGPATPAVTEVPAQPVAQKSGSTLLGILIGAVLAAGAGYGVQRYLVTPQTFDPSALETRLTAAEAESQALRAEIARLTEAMNTPPLVDQALLDRLAALEAEPDAGADVTPLIARIDGLEANLAALANLPSETGVAPAALATLQAEVAALKSQDSGVPVELSAMADAVEARLSEAEAKAADLTAQATAIATTATRNAALAQIGAALDSGLPFAAALTALGQEAAPDALSAHAATGLPSIATLRATFPDAARRGLEAALRAEPGDSWTERMATFLRNQTGARSLTPQGGTGPDAVLSRAEAALARADVPTALQELGTLPPDAQAAMADWTATAQQRLDAQAALAGLMQSAGQ